MVMFPRRAGKFMKSLLTSLNVNTFTAISAISDPVVSQEQPENVDRTVQILADMEYVEVQTDANGVKTLRLTPSGAAHGAALFVGAK